MYGQWVAGLLDVSIRSVGGRLAWRVWWHQCLGVEPRECPFSKFQIGLGVGWRQCVVIGLQLGSGLEPCQCSGVRPRQCTVGVMQVRLEMGWCECLVRK